jgi:hypothetical protein
MRRLLFATFSASILVTIVSVVHAVFLLGPSGYLEGVAANVEVWISFSASEYHRVTDDPVCCVFDSFQPCGGCDMRIPFYQKQ